MGGVHGTPFPGLPGSSVLHSFVACHPAERVQFVEATAKLKPRGILTILAVPERFPDDTHRGH